MKKTAIALSFTAAFLPGPVSADTEGIPSLNHVFLIMMENRNYKEVLDNNPAAPYLNSLANSAGTATNYQITMHPSLPNYLEIIAGSTYNIAADSVPKWGADPVARGNGIANSRVAPLTSLSIADQLDAAGKTWKSYQESLPATGAWRVNISPYKAGSPPLYEVMHNPFVYFANVQNSAHRNSLIVPGAQLQADLNNNAVPNLAFIVPNLCNDMHGQGGSCAGFTDAQLTANGDKAVHSLVNEITGSSAWHTGKNAIIVLWDENNDFRPGVGTIPAIVKTNYNTHSIVDGTAYTHDSMLRTLEDGLLGGTSSLSYLNNAAHANAMTPLFAASIPEPETYVLMLAGLGLVGVAARCRKINA
ncbi:alkaline phosphatase family protein [Nitrosospira briensis]|uniref:alkaline phosphatase family protein n=1 Tax=Nitrosospira briensis TaxID=35799 RepID=UPI00046AA6B7|nr:alkaline phosphatase family protein [Nitrosospira briensis]